jgi:hypothetical protein
VNDAPGAFSHGETLIGELAAKSFSSREIWAETLDCTVPSDFAAAEKDPWSAMARRLVSWRSSITKKDTKYLAVHLE